MRRASLSVCLLIGVLVCGCGRSKKSPYPVRTCQTELVYAPQPAVDGGVTLEGEWSGFSDSPMTRRSDGAFVATLTLDPRDYGYRFATPAGAVLDPAQPVTRWVGGVEYSRLRVPDCQAPAIELKTYSAKPDGSLSVAAQYVDGAAQRGPDLNATRVTLDEVKVKGAFDAKTGAFTLSKTGLAVGKHHVRIEAKDTQGRAAEPLYLPFWIEPAPFRFDRGALYFAFTDRFRDGNTDNDAPLAGVEAPVNYQGGDFAGITQAITDGYFDALGVKTLWISPWQPGPNAPQPGPFDKQYSGYHGYWPTQPDQTERRFGTLGELQALTAAAHQHGLRVIGDLVLNHVHQDHPYFAAHQADGWFNLAGSCVCGTGGCDWEARRLDCWFAPYLPDLDWRSPAVDEQLIDDAMGWLERADLDGFRVDAVKHMEPVAIHSLAARVREIQERTSTPLYLVGETFTGEEGRPLIASYEGHAGLDGQLDFPLYWSLVDAIGKGGSLTLLDAAVIANETAYPKGTLNAPFFGNQDLPRFASIAAGQIGADPAAQAWSTDRPPSATTDPEALFRVRAALGFAFSLPGVPLLYYGDEIALPGAGDPDNRRMMKFDAALTTDEAAVLAFTQALGKARTAHPALSSSDRRTLASEDDLLVYQREDPAGDVALFALWRGTTERTLSVDLTGALGAGFHPLHDLLGNATGLVNNGRAVLTLPAKSVALLVP